MLRLGLVGVLGATGAKGFYNSRAIKAEYRDIILKNLPPAFDGFRVGLITDIHAGHFVPPSMIRRGIRLVEAFNPDAVFLGGDFVAAATRVAGGKIGGFDPESLDACLDELAGLSNRYPAYGVLGNHDFWAGPQVTKRLIKGLETIGVKLLRNEAAEIKKNGTSIDLIGVDDYWESSYNLSSAVKNRPSGGCRILLSHNPDVNEDVEALKLDIDLIVSGHTHGGQIVIPWFGAPYLPSPFGQKYRAGLVRDGERQTYVSRGLGVFLVPVRLNCPSEVSLITLRRA